MLRKVISVTALGAAVFAAIPAAGAFADGPNTPPKVAKQIQAQSWPTLQRGDSSQTVRAAQYLLRGYHLKPGGGSKQYDIPTNGNFEAVTEKATKSFQGWRDLTETGKVGPATWESFSSDLKTDPIDSGHKNAEHVKAVQVLLNHWTAKCGYDAVGIDGQFGSGTKNATVAFQKCQKLDADGQVGPLTFKALVPDA